MKSNTLTGYLVDVSNELVGPVTISNTLESLYNVLNCGLIDITYLTLGGKEFCVIADDEGLLKDSPKISAVSKYGTPILVGNLMIVSANKGDDFVSLTSTDISLVEKYIGIIATKQHPHPYPVLCNISY